MSHYRRSIVAGASYFFTVNLADRRSNLLVTHIDRLRAAWREVERSTPFETVAVCVLPDHLHAIWRLPLDDGDYSGRWRRIKAGFSRGLPAAPGRSGSKRNKGEKGIWQRRFWEHQIRDERDLRNHVAYIHFNPVKHGWVENVADWPHSSFHRYVARGELPSDWTDAGSTDGFGE